MTTRTKLNTNTGSVTETTHTITLPKWMWCIIAGFAGWMTQQALQMNTLQIQMGTTQASIAHVVDNKNQINANTNLLTELVAGNRDRDRRLDEYRDKTGTLEQALHKLEIEVTRGKEND